MEPWNRSTHALSKLIVRPGIEMRLMLDIATTVPLLSRLMSFVGNSLPSGVGVTDTSK